MLEASTTFADLVEALSLPGCAVCRYQRRAVLRYLDALLYEQVNDPPLRARLRAAGGFCPRHAEDLLAARDALATAILYSDQLEERRRLLASWRREGRRVRPAARAAVLCPGCEVEQEAESRALDVLVEGINSPKLAEAWYASDGLCWPHFVAARQRAKGEAHALDEVEERAMAQLAADLEALIASFDYAKRGPLEPRAGRAWRRAVQFAAGLPPEEGPPERQRPGR